MSSICVIAPTTSKYIAVIVIGLISVQKKDAKPGTKPLNGVDASQLLNAKS